jgi:tetratricopeptide (TPR) repeat protein
LATRRRRVSIALATVAIAAAAAAFVLKARRPESTGATQTVAALGLADRTVADMFARARERAGAFDPEGNEEAIRLLRTVVSRAPDYAPAHALIARAYIQSVSDGMSRQGDTAWGDTALVHAQRAIMLAPSSVDGYAALGFIRASQVRYADAVPHYLRALELDPRHAQTMMDLARSYMALDRFDEAVTWQERALALEPLLPDARALVIARYNVWEIVDHAWRHVNEGLRLVPTDVHIQSQAMLLDLLVDDTASARRRLDAMQPLLTPAVRARMAMFYAMETRDPSGARMSMERIVGTGSNSQDFLTYGMVYRETGDRARGDSLVRLRLAALRSEDRRTRGASTQVAAALAHAYSVLGHADSAFTQFARWDSLGGVASRRRMAREPGWATLRGHPRWESVMARMHARFESGQKLMRDRLDRDLPPDSAARARVVPSR